MATKERARLLSLCIVLCAVGCADDAKDNNDTRLLIPVSNTRMVTTTTTDTGTTNATNTGSTATSTQTSTSTATATSTSTGTGVAMSKYRALKLNEVGKTDNTVEENGWFEVVNTSKEALDLTPCYFTSDRRDLQFDKVAPGTTIEAGGRMVFEVGVKFTKSGINNEGYLIFGCEGGEAFSKSWNNKSMSQTSSLARWPDATGDWYLNAWKTKGKPNIKPSLEVSCGDGEMDRGEECELAIPFMNRCEDFGFSAGSISCSDRCRYSYEMCQFDSAGVVLNEYRRDTVSEFELYNSSSQEVSLEGWTMKKLAALGVDDSNLDAANLYEIPTGTTIKPGEFLVIRPSTESDFRLFSSDGIFLRDEQKKIVDWTKHPSGAAVVGWCRQPDGTGDFTTCQTPTIGASNGTK